MNQEHQVVARAVTDEVDGYTMSVAGIEIESVRSGPSIGPTQVLGARGDRFTFTSSKIGFPMLSRTTIADDMVIVAHIRSARPGSRWCEIDLVPGSVLAYAPAAEHTACNEPGLEFMFAITEGQQLLETADRLGTGIQSPGRGEVHLLEPTASTDLTGDAFRTFAAAAESGTYPPSALGDDVLRAMVHVLSGDGRLRRAGHSNRIDSRHVVHACIDYAHSIRRIPSISELCATACVSERRLRQAFIDEFDLPPSRFFRAWALDEAHRRLACAEHDRETVTNVAMDLGFSHLGRFSAHFKVVYGETPSTTLNGREQPV